MRTRFGENTCVSSESIDITTLLRAWGDGDHSALDRLTPLVYDELRRVARAYMRRETASAGELQTTALVHEAYLRLAKVSGLTWRDRVHFFAVSAQIMRRILVDAARERAAAKRGGGFHFVDSDAKADELAALERSTELCALDDALSRLAQHDPRRARVVELRFFGGLTVDETAGVLNVSPRTVAHDWQLARAWLLRELQA
jgi:RNA polymerase sigma factor (TIGR02999 family)